MFLIHCDIARGTCYLSSSKLNTNQSSAADCLLRVKGFGACRAHHDTCTASYTRLYVATGTHAVIRFNECSSH